MEFTSADGEDGPHCEPVRRPLLGDEDAEYWFGEYSDTYQTPIERLLTDTVVVDWGGGDEERFSQEEFFKMWASIEPGMDVEYENQGYDELTNCHCAICERVMVSVPRLDHRCDCCGASKHDILRMEWQLYAEEQSRPPAQREQLFDIPIHTRLFQDGISCPSGHYLCSFCITDLPEKRPLSEADFPDDKIPITER